MIIFEESDGTEALHVGGVIYKVPGDPRQPRFLRSTDGNTFEPIPQYPGTFLGELGTESFRAMAVYNGRLFVTTGAAPLPDGVILSMSVFRNALYVGGTINLLRVHADDTWDLVVGDARWTSDGFKFPISGRASATPSRGISGVWNSTGSGSMSEPGIYSVFLRNVPSIGKFAAPEAGFDLWRTENGVFWRKLSMDGLGDQFNHGVRSLVSTPIGLVLGTANPWSGAEIWLGMLFPPKPCGPDPDEGPSGCK